MRKIKTSSSVIIILIPVLLFTSFEARRSRQQCIEYVSEYIELMDVDNQIISIEDVVKDKRFVYQFSESTCYRCVEEDFDRILKLGRVIGFDKIIVIPDYRNIRLLQIRN